MTTGYILNSNPVSLSGGRYGTKWSTLVVAWDRYRAVLLGEDANDWVWHDNDGTDPTTAGNEGGWSLESGNPNNKNSALIDVGFNPDVNSTGLAATVCAHSADDDFEFWELSGGDVVSEAGPFATGWTTNDIICCTVANDGRGHAFAEVGGTLETRSTNTGRTSLNSAVAIVASGVDGTQGGGAGNQGIVKACYFTDGTDWYVGCFYQTTGDEIKFIYCKDGDDPTSSGNWTTETVRDMTDDSNACDDHFDVGFGVLPGDSATTICISYKDSDNEIWAQRCKKTVASTSWDSAVSVATSKTRTACGLDLTNGDFYVAYLDTAGGAAQTASYKSADATTTLSFSSETLVLDDASTETFSYLHMPDNNVTGDLDLCIIGYQVTDNEVWFNKITLADPAILISVNSCAHSHTVDSPAIIQTHSIAVDDANHSHSSESPVITQSHIVAIDDANHAHEADSPSITQTHLISIDDAFHSHTTESPAITQTHIVDIDDGLHSHAVESPSITQTHIVTIDGAVHSHSAESPAVTITAVVDIDDAAHAHAADSPAITQTHLVAVNDSAHDHSAESPTLSQSITVAVDDSLHSHTADSPSVTQTHVVAIDDAVHLHSAESPIVTQTHVVVVQDASSLTTATIVTVTIVISTPSDAFESIAGEWYQVDIL